VRPCVHGQVTFTGIKFNAPPFYRWICPRGYET
jgi:hypothetical protein